MKRPNSELVAIYWLRTCPDLDPTKVNTTLPRDVTVWADTGFVQVANAVGGEPDRYAPLRHPVVQVDCWAVRPDSGRPPWGHAGALSEAILDYTYSRSSIRVVDMPSDYVSARVLCVSAISEPRRGIADVANYAHYTIDLELNWAPVTSQIPS